jgi:acetyl/propionyl-CoA carboxylase alpha subunit
MQVRINGEDPSKDYRPSPGQLGCVSFPCDPADHTVRVDTWVETGAAVSPHYDSLLAKAMVWAPTRAEAAAKMSALLAQIKLQVCYSCNYAPIPDVTECATSRV